MSKLSDLPNEFLLQIIHLATPGGIEQLTLCCKEIYGWLKRHWRYTGTGSSTTRSIVLILKITVIDERNPVTLSGFWLTSLWMKKSQNTPPRSS